MEQKQDQARLNPAVFYPAAGLIVVILLFAAILPEVADSWFQTLQGAIITNASWFYVLAVADRKSVV